MWAPIFVNFFHILFIIFGFYGAYHFRIKYIITYLIWNFLWIGWNSFLICFYLNIGTLDRDSDLLNLGTGSVSWFEVNGYGCKPVYNATNITSDDPFRPLRPDRVDDCLLTYDLVEVAQSGVQCLLSFFGILGAILISYIFLDEDDRFDFMNGDAKSPQHTVVHPMYVSYTSIPTSASATMLSNKHNANSYHNNSHYNAHSLSNSNQLHLSNSNHAMHSITTTPNATATKKSQQQQHQQQQQQQQQQQHSSSLILLHNNTKNLFSNNTSSTTNNSNGNSQSHSNSNIKNHSYSNSNSNNNNSNSNSNTFLIHTHTKNNSNNNNGSNFINNSNHNSNFGGGGGGGSSNGHHHQLQQPPAPHSRQGSFNGSFSSSHNQYQFNPPPASASASQQRKKLSLQSSSYNSRSNTPNASRNSTLTHMLYSPKQIRKFGSSSSNSIFPANTSTAIDFAAQKPAINGYYDDSTAKADHQLYVNGSRRHIMATTPTQDTTPSLSYASLDNSNQVRVSGGVGGGGATTASLGSDMASPLSNSNYSLTNSINNNMPASASSHSGGGGGGGHFARIHSKPKPAKSSSYSSFAHATNTASSNGSNMQRPEHNRMSNNFDETFEDDTFSLQNFKTDEGVTYVPFGKPTPGSYYPRGGENNNPSYASINSSFALEENSLNNNNNGSSSISIHQLRTSPNNNTHVSATAAVTTPTLPPAPPTEFCNDNAGILLENGAVLHPIINPAQRIMHQQNGLPFHPAYSPMAYRPGSTCSAQVGPVRPTNIPLPTVPDYEHSTELISPSAVTPPPPPQPRPHIFQPRTGCAPYPDLSPEVTERYAMPTQYIPRSPVASRIARRQRLQQQQQELQSRNVAAANGERSHLPIPSANFVDQIRDCPPGYGSGGRNSFKISRTKSHDRLSSSQNSSFREKEQQRQAQRDNAMAVTSVNKELMAPHVNRRSERKDAVKVRPRSYCNSITNGDGVIRTNIAADRELSEGIAYVA